MHMLVGNRTQDRMKRFDLKPINFIRKVFFITEPTKLETPILVPDMFAYSLFVIQFQFQNQHFIDNHNDDQILKVSRALTHDFSLSPIFLSISLH